METLLETKINSPKEALEFVRSLLQSIRSEECFKTVLAIAGLVLEKEEISDLEAKEMLAMKLLDVCFNMGSMLDQAFIEEETFRAHLFIWDWIFFKHLIGFGAHGKEFAGQIIIRLKENCFYYEKDKRADRLLKNWKPQEDLEPNFFPPVLLILAEALWLDLTKNVWIRKKKTFLPCPREYGSLRLSHFWPEGKI